MLIDEANLDTVVSSAVNNAEITDVHTHLYPPSFGDMLLWGVDELLNYHYLVAETMRYLDISYDTFWSMNKKERADLIFKTLFIDNSPVSEACRGVLTNLHKMDFDLSTRNLDEYRNHYKGITKYEYFDKIFETAKIKYAVMTNDPFNEEERNYWLKYESDGKLKGALRLDVLLNTPDIAIKLLQNEGYKVNESFDSETIEEIKRFIKEWILRIKAVYMAVSLPYDFEVFDGSIRSRLIEECIIPVTRQLNIPFAMMIGVKRQINPLLKDAGDGVGKADIKAVENLCAKYPYNKFMVTMLSKENQHELIVAARKFRNLMPFGCWWFLNNPSIIDEITLMRCEMLGLSFIPQHSDARVLDQLVYKWAHSRQVIANCLIEKYKDIIKSGWKLDSSEIERDVNNLFNDNFWDFVNRKML